MSAWIVADGSVRPYDPATLPDRGDYGHYWLYVEAASAADALERATEWDLGRGPAEAELFAVAYRAGVVHLPGEDW